MIVFLRGSMLYEFSMQNNRPYCIELIIVHSQINLTASQGFKWLWPRHLREKDDS